MKYKDLLKKEIITFEDKNDTYSINLKRPIWTNFNLFINDIIGYIYTKFWNLLPFYSSYWYYKLMPQVPFYNWWLVKQMKKYNAI